MPFSTTSSTAAADAQIETDYVPVRMLVLASSAKQRQCCVAGKRILSQQEQNQTGRVLGEWVRPVTALDGTNDAVPLHAFGGCLPLAKIALRLQPSTGASDQPENRLWHTSGDIQQLGQANRLRLSGLNDLIDTPTSIWDDPRALRDDQLLPGMQSAPTSSLFLIQPQQLEVYGGQNAYGAPRIYARFLYNGKIYDRLPITDPQIHHILSSRWDRGSHDAPVRLPKGDHYWLTVSLTKPFGENHCRYKLIAAVIEQP